MHLHLHLSHPSPVKQHHRRPGPSRLRRRARREEARLAAANAATKETSNKKDTAEVAVQVDKTARVTCDAAVQADHSSTAVQATHHPQATHHHPAVEAVPKHPAAQAIVARQHPVVQSAPRQPRKKLVDKISSFGGHTGKKVSVSESSTQKEQDRLAIHNLKLHFSSPTLKLLSAPLHPSHPCPPIQVLELQSDFLKTCCLGNLTLKYDWKLTCSGHGHCQLRPPHDQQNCCPNLK